MILASISGRRVNGDAAGRRILPCGGDDAPLKGRLGVEGHVLGDHVHAGGDQALHRGDVTGRPRAGGVERQRRARRQVVDDLQHRGALIAVAGAEHVDARRQLAARLRDREAGDAIRDDAHGDAGAIEPLRVGDVGVVQCRALALDGIDGMRVVLAVRGRRDGHHPGQRGRRLDLLVRHPRLDQAGGRGQRDHDVGAQGHADPAPRPRRWRRPRGTRARSFRRRSPGPEDWTTPRGRPRCARATIAARPSPRGRSASAGRRPPASRASCPEPPPVPISATDREREDREQQERDREARGGSMRPSGHGPPPGNAHPLRGPSISARHGRKNEATDDCADGVTRPRKTVTRQGQRAAGPEVSGTASTAAGRGRRAPWRRRRRLPDRE